MRLPAARGFSSKGEEPYKPHSGGAVVPMPTRARSDSWRCGCCDNEPTPPWVMRDRAASLVRLLKMLRKIEL